MLYKIQDKQLNNATIIIIADSINLQLLDIVKHGDVELLNQFLKVTRHIALDLILFIIVAHKKTNLAIFEYLMHKCSIQRECLIEHYIKVNTY